MLFLETRNNEIRTAGTHLGKDHTKLTSLLLLTGILSSGVYTQIALQADDATIYQGVVESEHAGYTGSGYVKGDNITGRPEHDVGEW